MWKKQLRLPHFVPKTDTPQADLLEADIEKKLTSQDEAIAAMFSAIRELMKPNPPNRRGIGFTADIDQKE